MKNKYVIIGAMALIFSGIIFSLIFLILLKKTEKEERAKVKIPKDKAFIQSLESFLMYGGYWMNVETWFALQVLFIITAMFLGMMSDGLVASVKNSFLLLLMLEMLLYVTGKYEIKKKYYVKSRSLPSPGSFIFSK